jgi:hypothetical protein
VGVLVFAALAANARVATADPGAVALATRVPRFLIHNATVLDGVAQLSSENFADRHRGRCLPDERIDRSTSIEAARKPKWTTVLEQSSLSERREMPSNERFESPTAITHDSSVLPVFSSVWQSHSNP